MAGIFDTANIPTGEPDSLYVGDLIRWRRTDLSNTYDPTLYDLKYSFRQLSAKPVEVEITATSDATGFYTDVDSATSDDWQPGTYKWQAYIVRKSDSVRVSIDAGQTTFLVNLDNAANTDIRTHAAKMVDMLQAALESRAGSDVIYYMIGGRAVSKIPPKELRALLSDYESILAGEVAADRRARGLRNSNSITARFVE